MKPIVEIASSVHVSYATSVSLLLEESARSRGVGRGRRSPEMIIDKIKNGQAIIAFYDGELAGFSYLDAWDNENLVANSGLIVNPKFRGLGIAKAIKIKATKLATIKYPKAKLFSITTSLPVMKLNTELGYVPVTYSELPKDHSFWKGCQGCPNYKNLKEKDYKLCFCTAMLLSNIKQSLKNINHEK